MKNVLNSPPARWFRLLPVMLALGTLLVAQSLSENATERPGQEPFTFAQMCDTQLGMGGYEHDVKTFEQAVVKINKMAPDFVVICGDLVNRSNDRSFADFNRIKSGFKIPCYCASGNHDVENTPTAESLRRYREKIGKDYYTFEHKGFTFVVANTQLWKAPLAGESDRHDAWFKEALEAARAKGSPVVVVVHYPLYLNKPDEKEVYFNLPVAKRNEILDLCEKNGVVAVLGGHTHKFMENRYKGIQLVNGETTSKNFDKRPMGFRLWEVDGERGMKHRFVGLEPTLRGAALDSFTIGAGIGHQLAKPERRADWPLLTEQFGGVTPENCMKVKAVQPEEGKFRFADADRFMKFAAQRDLPVVGHCLVWAKDDRTPPWFFKDGEKAASKELLLARMKTHIETVAGRYKGKVVAWDVVNEVLDDGQPELRPSSWLSIAGEEFIAKAFEYAHAVDPDAILIYNDYHSELPRKRAKMLKLLRKLLDQGVPIHAVGIQGHYTIDKVPYGDLEVTLDAVRELGLKVFISELDIDMIPRGRWWADGGAHREEMAKINPYPDGLPDDLVKRQSEQYAKLFRLYRKHADIIERVTFWNLHDGESWLNTFPWDRVNHPLLFDRERQPKPAFDAVIGVLEE